MTESEHIGDHQAYIQTEIDEINRDIHYTSTEVENDSLKLGHLRSLLNGSRLETESINGDYLIKVKNSSLNYNINDESFVEEKEEGCLVHQDEPNDSIGSRIKDVSTCELNENSQLFKRKIIGSDEEYNDELIIGSGGQSVNEYHNIPYPFDMIYPTGKEGECLNMDDGKLMIKPCSGAISERFQYTPE
jgi:hypothetical protein